MVSATTISLSGLRAASLSAEASASNIANARTAGRISDAKLEAGPTTSQSDQTLTGYRPVHVRQDAVEPAGVRATLQAIDPPQVAAYDPTNPLADEQGMVAMPRVEIENEVVNLIQARRAYEANLKVVAAEDKMTGSLLDTIR